MRVFSSLSRAKACVAISFRAKSCEFRGKSDTKRLRSNTSSMPNSRCVVDADTCGNFKQVRYFVLASMDTVMCRKHARAAFGLNFASGDTSAEGSCLKRNSDPMFSFVSREGVGSEVRGRGGGLLTAPTLASVFNSAIRLFAKIAGIGASFGPNTLTVSSSRLTKTISPVARIFGSTCVAVIPTNTGIGAISRSKPNTAVGRTGM
mmetsp:Transcript_30859/g.60390  ORF Transcript_30859/g.60390 Transcript_30859/m.60390 type:complete len:205 (-) Transcript_30859:555-1169(-)